MSAVSIERIRDWILARRTTKEYAFPTLDIAAGVGASPVEVFVLCTNAISAGMLSGATVGNAHFFTHPVVGFEAEIGSRRMKALLDDKRVVQVAGKYEWAPTKRVVREGES